MTAQETGTILPFAQGAAIRMRLAKKQRDAGQPFPALCTVLNALASTPDDPEALWTAAELYQQLECPHDAILALLRLLHTQESSALVYLALAQNLAMEGIPSAARDALALALTEAQSDDTAYEAQTLLEELEEDTALSQEERRQHLRLERVIHALERGCTDLALRLSRRLLMLDKRYAPAHVLRAFIFRMEGDARKSLEAARQAVRSNPDEPRAWCAVALALCSMGQSDAAERLLKKRVGQWLLQTPDDQNIYVLAVHTALDMEAKAWALELLEAWRALAPYAVEPLTLEAVFFWNQGERVRCKECLTLLQQISPDHTLPPTLLQNIDNGDLPHLEYTLALPQEMIIDQLAPLRQLFRQGDTAIKAQWQGPDPSLAALLQRGLSMCPVPVAEGLLDVLRQLGGPRAVRVLETLLGDPSIDDSLKRMSIMILIEIAPPKARLALIHGRLVLAEAKQITKEERDETMRRLGYLASQKLPNMTSAERVQLAALVTIAMTKDMRALPATLRAIVYAVRPSAMGEKSTRALRHIRKYAVQLQREVPHGMPEL